MRGRFIVFEGPDRAGKTTQAARLARALAGRKITRVREPGSTPLGEAVRKVLFDCRRTRLTPHAEIFLYMAARAQLVRDVILPALAKGRVVISDRFLYSSVAYQGVAGGVGAREVLSLGKIATQGLRPDVVFFLDLPPEEAFKRSGGKPDRIERKPLAYHRKVRAGFLKAADALGPRAVVLDARQREESIHAEILKRVKGLL